MRSRLGPRGAIGVLGFLAACVIGAVSGGGADAAPAQEPHRAVVVVDSGSGTAVEGIEFSADSISGLEALQLAGMSPVVWASPGEGGAVCALRGVGCPADNRCLTCQAPNYWAYHRAPAGSSTYAYSQVGAGSTRVHDGDVEGWRWGTGAAPAYHSLDSVFGAPPPPPSGSGGSGNGNGAGGTGESAGGGSGPGSANPDDPPEASGAGSTGPTTTVAPGSTTTTEAPGAERGVSTAEPGRSDEDALEAAPASSRRPQEGSSRNWMASAVLFVIVLGVVLALIVRARRQRAAPASGP